MKFRLPRLQFSLRTLVIVVVLVAVPVSWHGSRYARYRARMAARVEAAERGLSFYTLEEAESLYGGPLSTVNEPTVWDKYDVFCFGREASRFPVCALSMYEIVEKQPPYQPGTFHKVLELHPEVDIVDVSLHKRITNGPTPFQRVAWAIGMNDSIEKSNSLARAMNDLTQRPTLRKFLVDSPAEIDGAWVEALPEPCSLIEIQGNLVLSPRSVRLLLKKAPRLEKFEIPSDLFDQDVRDAVELKYHIAKYGSTIQLRAKP
jgi:hypothetical protein